MIFVRSPVSACPQIVTDTGTDTDIHRQSVTVWDSDSTAKCGSFSGSTMTFQPALQPWPLPEQGIASGVGAHSQGPVL